MKFVKVILIAGLLLGFAPHFFLNNALSFDRGHHTVFGPERFERDRGRPETEKRKFTVHTEGSNYTLLLFNGERDRHRDRDREPSRGRDRDRDRHKDDDDVSSATVTLNGNEIIGPSDFHHGVKLIERNVTLRKRNVLTVQLQGKRGSFITIAIVKASHSATVPNVVGMTQANAQTAITAANLTVGTITTASSTTVPAGTIISQTPVAGTTASQGSAVNLVVSSGQSTVSVPNVVGMTQANAQTAITAANLTVSTITTTSSTTVPAGSVISQTPAAGTTASQGSVVNLVVSSGLPTVSVPNVVGMTQANAQTAITAANLTVGTITTASSTTVPIGNVISQSPIASATAVQGSSVNLVVSSGPATVTVPNVFGKTQTDAQAALAAANLVAGTITTTSSTTAAAGTVIGQNPAGGTTTLAGTAVALVVSSGPPPLIVPDVTGQTQQAAGNTLTTKGLTLGTVTSVNSTTAIVGTVISQNPAAGTTAVSGAAVSIVISLGPAANTSTVPKVNGLTQSDAATAITAAGLTVGAIGSDYSSSVTSGTVISQYPLASAKAPAGSAVNLIVSRGPATTIPVPVDPQTIAPALDTTVTTTVAASTSFLYTGTDPIQTGVPTGTIEVRRAAVVRGLATDRTNQPLSGVKITIKDHPEFGQTYTRSDGMFDMAVNGGGSLTVAYEKTGYFPAHRQITVPWQDYAWLPDVVLIPVDTQVTTVNFSSSAQMQVHQGTVVTDTTGTRQATLLFSSGTTAQMVMSDGSTQSAASLNIRATEYTVGTNGPKTMPASLPAASGYTYAVELSADEAIAAGAKQITFSQPVYVYVDNFIGFPTGETVPSGYYDRDKGQWIPSQNGRVIKILSITGGLADIDTDGTGQAGDATKLAALAITDTERQQLATLYPQTPKQLWRVPVTHFSTWDFNWPYGPPSDATAPKQPPPAIAQTQDPCEECGSIIEAENQVLGERIGVPGTPFTLNYRSSRAPGYTPTRSVDIPISGASVPASLKRIDVIIQLAGRRFSQSFSAATNQTYTFTWDGKDAFGRTMQGTQPLKVNIGYVYGLVYLTAKPLGGYDEMFGHFTYYGSPVSALFEEREITIWQAEQLSVGSYFDARSQGLGGWDLDSHHVYDPAGKTLLLGDGGWRSAKTLGASVITTAAGSYKQGSTPSGVAVGPDGSIYTADYNRNRILRVGTDGVMTTIAGNGTAGYGGDGGPATSAMFSNPIDVAVGPDGSIYIADYGNNRIRRVSPDGIITTVAGNGDTYYFRGGDGIPATNAAIYFPTGVAVGPDGSIYIADRGNNRIRRVRADGIITTVAGRGNYDGDYGGDGGLGTSAAFSGPRSVAVGPDGIIYIADEGNHRIRRIGPNGIITTVAGNGAGGYSGDGGPATSASLYGPGGVAVGTDGSIYIADQANLRIRRVGPDGIITTVAGNGVGGYSGDGGSATSASFYTPFGVAVGPDGIIYIADYSNFRIRRVGPVWPSLTINDIYIPSDDGSQLYLFNSSGKHQRTLNALTGATVFGFSYDSNGRLAAVTDGDGNITTIEKDANGNATAIVAPFGQRTTLAINADGYLASLTNPAGEATRMTYSDTGLLSTYTDPKGNIHTFTYDTLGLLTRDENPAGGYTALTGTKTLSSKQKILSTALGRTTTYLTDYLTTNDQRETITSPTGAQSVTVTRTNGSNQSTLPDGTITSVTPGIDPRFGTLVDLPSSATVKAPSGLTGTITINRTATFDPNNNLNLTTQTDTLSLNGKAYTKVFDASHLTYTATTPSGRKTTLLTDNQGRPLSLTLDTAISPLTITYDSRGMMQQMVQGNQQSSYVYDSLGRVASRTDALGNMVKLSYDNADQVTQLTLPSGRTYGFAYDANGNRTQLTMPSGAVHKLGYTVIDLSSDYTPPGNSPYSWQYSLDQEWTRTTLPGGRTVDAGYDSGGRPLGTVYAEATVSLSYNDQTNRLSRMLRTPAGGSSVQQLAYTYDGSLVTGNAFTGVSNGQFTYTYDNNFLLKQINLASGTDNIATAITRDTDGLVTGAGSFTFARTGPAGAVSGISDTASNIAVTYDTLGRVATRTHTVNSKTIYSLQLSYDSTGNISQKTETVTGYPAVTWKYTYDADGQLVQVAQNGVTQQQYTYDVNGNRTTYQLATTTTLSSTYDSQDRLVQQGGTSYQFNADGQLIQRGTDTFQYSAQGELVQASVNGKTVTYAYDGMGRQIARTNSTGTWQYLYGNLGQPFQLTAMRDPAGSLTYFHYDNSGHLFAMDKGGATYYVGADQVGTPKVVTDATGNIVKLLEFDSFGAWTLDSNADFVLPVGFAGGVIDTDTQLVRFGYRDYEPGTGRWTAKDPIFFEGGQGNLYQYVQNNPVNWVDPEGLSAGTLTLPAIQFTFPNLSGLAAFGRVANPVGAFLAVTFYDGNTSAGPYEEAMVTQINRVNPNVKGSTPNYKKPKSKSKSCPYKGKGPKGPPPGEFEKLYWALMVAAGSQRGQDILNNIPDFADTQLPGTTPSAQSAGGFYGTLYNTFIKPLLFR